MNVYIKEEGQCWKYKITWEITHSGSKFGLALKSKIRYFWNFAVNGGRDSSYNKCFFSLLWSFISQFVSVCKMRLPDAQQKMASALTFRSFQVEQDKESLPVQLYKISYPSILLRFLVNQNTALHSVCPVRSSVTWRDISTFLDILMVNPWKPYISWMHIILADHPDHLDHPDHPTILITATNRTM